MKVLAFKIGILFLFVGFLFTFSAKSILAQNAINGMIFDNNRKPISDIDVELLDGVERLIASKKTRGGGFYSFQPLSRGIYYIKVRVGGTGFKEKKVRVDLGDLNSIGGVDIKQIDLFLEVDSRRSKKPLTTGVIFAQNVPEQAKKMFENGLQKQKADKKTLPDAAQDFLKAIEIFPDYFDALFRLADIYLAQRKFREAENVLSKAVKINPKSDSAFYGIAYAQSRLNRRAEAIANLKKAINIDSSSVNSYFLLGKLQRDLKQYKDAENSLIKAKTLASNKNPDINYDLALLYYHNLGKRRKAADELELYVDNLSKSERKKNRDKVSVVKKLIKKIRSEAK